MASSSIPIKICNVKTNYEFKQARDQQSEQLQTCESELKNRNVDDCNTLQAKKISLSKKLTFYRISKLLRERK